MKYTLPHLKRTGLAGSTAALGLLVSLMPLSTLAKPGNGKGGGGGGGDEPTDPGVIINPVPNLLEAAPISYTATELVWNGDIDGNVIPDKEEAAFQGVTFNGINNQGIVVSFIAGPGTSDRYPTDAENLPRVVGGINVDSATGQIANEMFDLNKVFETSLDTLNSDRTDGPWRIGYGRSITEGGLVALQLIPDSAPYLIHDGTVDCLLAVGDLNRRLNEDAIMVLPINTSGFNDHLQLTAEGSALVLELREGGFFSRVFPLGENSNGEVGYFLENEMPVPAIGYSKYPGIKDSDTGEFFPEFIYSRVLQVTQKTSVYQVVSYRYSWDGSVDEDGNRIDDIAEETILHERENNVLYGEGFGTGGTAFGSAQETVGNGKNSSSYWTPYHLLSPTERTPLVEPLVSARVQVRNWSISDAVLLGEEEVVIELEANGEIQVYKPNFAARFTLPIDPGSQRLVEISSPVNADAITSDYSLGAGDYSAGYVGYGTNAEPDRVFVLTPAGAPVPGQ